MLFRELYSPSSAWRANMLLQLATKVEALINVAKEYTGQDRKDDGILEGLFNEFSNI